MTKAQLIAAIAEETTLPRQKVKEVLGSLVKQAIHNAASGVAIPDLGKLVLVDRPARMARNPRTNQMVQVPARRVLKFRLAKSAKDAVLNS